MNTTIINTPDAPQPLGPYSQAIAVNGFVFLSGQIALDAQTNQMVGATVAEQTLQIMKNISAVLASQALGFSSIVKATVFLRSMAAFAEFNAAYEAALAGHKPARSTVEVSNLPKNALIEIEVVACR